MQINQVKRIHPNMKRVIVARGGKRGKTAGRGGKGQSARAGNKRRPEWRDIIKKLPKLRGRGKNSNKTIQTKPLILNISILENNFKAGEAVNPKILAEKGVVTTYSGNIPKIKILGDGEITKALNITGMIVSASAFEKITKAGGTAPALKVKKVYVRPVAKVEAPKAPKAKAPKAEKTAKPAEKKESKPVSSEKKDKPVKKEKESK